jgi:glycosyltransferase involved in cell wall biosynthesis
LKKSILFHYPIFNIGGAEMSILRLTKMFADNGWEVELVCTTGGGELESALDPRVKLSSLRSKSAGNKFKAQKSILGKILCLPDLLHYLYRRVEEFFKKIKYRFKHYDAAVISLHGLSPDFCCNVVSADAILHWIRNDLSSCDPHGKATNNIKRYNSQVDNYICVSGTTHNSFVSVFPELSDKATLLYNVIDAADMRSKAEVDFKPFENHTNLLKVVTVCRLFDQAKGLFRMLDLHKKLKENGYDFCWYVIGEGSDRAAIEAKIKEYDLIERFILLGKKDNPFPYYKYADLVAVLSYYEGLCGVVNEAKVTGKAVIATEVSGIHEQLENNQNGIIVENDFNAIFEGLKLLLTDDNLRKKITNTDYPEVILNDQHKFKMLTNLITKKSIIK